MSARDVEKFVKHKKSVNQKTTSVDANIKSIEKKLENHLGLKVTISNKKNNSGKVTVEYKDLSQFDMLNRLLSSS